MSYALSTQQIAEIKAVIDKLDDLSAELDNALSGHDDERMFTADEVAEILTYAMKEINVEYNGYGDIEIEIEIPIEIRPEGGYSETCHVNTSANKDASEVLREIEDDFVFNFASGEASEVVDNWVALQAEKKAKAQRELEAQKELEAQQAQDAVQAPAEALPNEVEQVNDTEG